MRTLSFVAVSAALVTMSVARLEGQARDSVWRGGAESVLASIERGEMSNDARVKGGDRDDAGRGWSWGRDRDNGRGRYESRKDREREEARWRKQKEREMRSCQKDLWSRVRRERDRWDDDRYVRSTKDRIRRICERRVYGWGRDWDGRIFDRFDR